MPMLWQLQEEDRDAAKKAQLARSKKYGIGVKGGGNATKPAAYADVPDGKFADPVNYRYPLSPDERAVNAVTRFNDSDNKGKGGYTDAEWSKLGQRISKANAGKVYRDGQVVDQEEQESESDDSLDTFVEATAPIQARFIDAQHLEGKEFDIVIIGPETAEDLVVEGDQTYVRSKNGRLYNVEGLKAATAVFEGAKAYDNHLTDDEFQAKQGMRSVANEWVGVIAGVRWDEKIKSLVGKLKVVDEKLRSKLKAAWEAGVLGAIGRP